MSISTDSAGRQPAAWISAAGLGDRLSVALFAPHLAWVSFASLLDASIWWPNR
jgi:tryptophan-rich sensory protein